MIPYDLIAAIMLVLLLAQLGGLLLYHSADLVIRIGCWLIAWGVGRREAKKIQARHYGLLLGQFDLKLSRSSSGASLGAPSSSKPPCVRANEAV